MRMTQELMDRFLKNECTSEEISFVCEYFIQYPYELEHWMPFDDWKSIEEDVHASYNELKLYKIIRENIKINRQWNCNIIRGKKVAVQIAASVIIVITCLLFFNLIDRDTLREDGSSKELVYSDNPNRSNLYYINSSNKVMHIEASDNSLITLYPNSEIRFSEDFESTGSRDFYLVGKAKFKVTKDTTKAFQVFSKGMKTIALGTVFVVDEFYTSQTTKVKLLEGMILVKSGQEKYSTVLKESEEIEYDSKSNKIVGKIETKSSSSDRGGYYKEENKEIIIQNMNVLELIHILENNFGIEIDHQLGMDTQKYYTGSFPKRDDIFQLIIDEINYLHSITMKWEKRKQ